MTADRWADLRAKDAARTPGEWSVSGAIGGVRVNDSKGRWIAHPGKHADAEFIAATTGPNGVHTLLEENERLQQRVRAYNDAANEVQHEADTNRFTLTELLSDLRELLGEDRPHFEEGDDGSYFMERDNCIDAGDLRAVLAKYETQAGE